MLLNEFIYGLDFVQFDDDDEIIIWDTKREAELEIDYPDDELVARATRQGDFVQAFDGHGKILLSCKGIHESRVD